MPGTYTITATSVSDPTKKNTATVIVPLGISIVPSKAVLLTSSKVQFRAQVTGSTNTAVNWNVWEPTGGSISNTGQYSAPMNPGIYHISATSQADTNAVTTAKVTVVRDNTYMVDPEHITVRPGAKVSFKVLGPDISTAKITWQTGGGTITSSGVLTAPTNTGTFTVLAYVTTDITRVVSSTVTVTTTAPVDSVTVTPSEIELNKGGTTTFTAQVNGGITGTVTWSVVSTNAGTIDANTGAYSAPDAFGTYTVKATSTEDSTAYGTATVTVKAFAGTDKTFTYDENGNMTGDGERSFEWDAENRLIAVVITTTGHRSEFGYDGLGRRVMIRELDPDANKTLQVTSDKKYLWDGVEIAEERDTTGGIVQKRFYSQGFIDNDGTKLFYTRDHLGSIRELVDMSQTVRARYDYDPYGRPTKISGDRDSAFQYAGYFWHPQSGLDLTWFRAYDPNLGRWISRDPIGENGGINLYGYVENDPIGFVDPYGLWTAINPLSWLDGDKYQGAGFEFFTYDDYLAAAGATLDGMIPFGNPFSDLYNPCETKYKVSKALGGVSAALIAAAGGAAIYELVGGAGSSIQFFAKGGNAWHLGLETADKWNLIHIGMHPTFGFHLAVGATGAYKAAWHLYLWFAPYVYNNQLYTYINYRIFR